MSAQADEYRGQSPRTHADPGFTLVELLVATIIAGLLLTALSSAIFVILNQRSRIETRLDSTRGPQFSNQFFADDIAAANPTKGVQTNEAGAISALCLPTPAPTSATALLNVQYQSFNDARTLRTRVITYATVPARSGNQLVRYSCTSDDQSLEGKLPLTARLTGADVVVIVSRLLTQAPAAKKNCDGVANSVCLTFVTENANIRLYGAPRKDPTT